MSDEIKFNNGEPEEVLSDGDELKSSGEGKHSKKDKIDIVSRYARLETLTAVLKALLVLMVAVCLSLVGACMYLGSLPKTVPYVIEVYSDGSARYDESAVRLMENWTPTESQKRNVVMNYVRNMRTVSYDNYVNKENAENVYAMSTDEAALLVDTWYTDNNPITRSANSRVNIPIDEMTVLKYSDTQYKVTWRETETSRAGQILSDGQYEGLFTLMFYENLDSKQRVRNPLGIFITTYDLDLLKNLM